MRAFHELPEEQEECGCGSRGGEDVADGLGKKHRHGLVLEEVRQNEDQGDQQNELSQAGEEQTDFCLAQGDKCLLAAVLEACGEAARQEDPHGPGGVIHQSLLIGKDTGKKGRKQLDQQPEKSGVADAHGKLAKERFLYPGQLLCAVVVAHEGLPALGDAGQGHVNQLYHGGQHRHGAHGHVAAVAEQGGSKADGENAFGGDHDKGGNTQAKAGADDPGLQNHIAGPEPQHGFLTGKKAQNPHRADSLAQHRGDGGSRDTQVQTENQNGVQDDIDDSTDDRGEHADFGKALGGDKGVHAHDHQHKDAAQGIDPSVGYAVGDGVAAAAEKPDQLR